MKLHILAVGRLKSGPERGLTDDYLTRSQRLARPLGFEAITLKECDAKPTRSAESESLLTLVPQGARMVVLDEGGRSSTSRDFAEQLAKLRDDGQRECCFLIGGADGHDPSLKHRADQVMAFGVQTWPHKLVRVMLAEQIYRALSLLAGHPYHRD